MKKLFVVTLALFTILTLGAFAQDQSAATSTKKTKKSSTATTETSKTKASKSEKLNGTIGSDGKTFTNDADNSSWTINNPDKVKGHEGHKVVLRGTADAAAKTITVKSVTMAGEKSAAGTHKGKSKKSTATTSPSGK